MEVKDIFYMSAMGFFYWFGKNVGETETLKAIEDRKLSNEISALRAEIAQLRKNQNLIS
jgi:hypothetical protein